MMMRHEVMLRLGIPDTMVKKLKLDQKCWTFADLEIMEIKISCRWTDFYV